MFVMPVSQTKGDAQSEFAVQYCPAGLRAGAIRAGSLCFARFHGGWHGVSRSAAALGRRAVSNTPKQHALTCQMKGSAVLWGLRPGAVAPHLGSVRQVFVTGSHVRSVPLQGLVRWHSSPALDRCTHTLVTSSSQTSGSAHWAARRAVQGSFSPLRRSGGARERVLLLLRLCQQHNKTSNAIAHKRGGQVWHELGARGGHGCPAPAGSPRVGIALLGVRVAIQP